MQTQLKFRHVIILVWWLVWKSHKAKAMQFFEDKGMTEIEAFKKAKITTKQQYYDLVHVKM